MPQQVGARSQMALGSPAAITDISAFCAIFLGHVITILLSLLPTHRLLAGFVRQEWSAPHTKVAGLLICVTARWPDGRYSARDYKSSPVQHRLSVGRRWGRPLWSADRPRRD
jgi:hypothetical protein